MCATLLIVGLYLTGFWTLLPAVDLNCQHNLPDLDLPDLYLPTLSSNHTVYQRPSYPSDPPLLQCQLKIANYRIIKDNFQLMTLPTEQFQAYLKNHLRPTDQTLSEISSSFSFKELVKPAEKSMMKAALLTWNQLVAWLWSALQQLFTQIIPF